MKKIIMVSVVAILFFSGCSTINKASCSLTNGSVGDCTVLDKIL